MTFLEGSQVPGQRVLNSICGILGFGISLFCGIWIRSIPGFSLDGWNSFVLILFFIGASAGWPRLIFLLLSLIPGKPSDVRR
jgi:hypothetical protein